jgi:hypothetical protein
MLPEQHMTTHGILIGESSKRRMMTYSQVTQLQKFVNSFPEIAQILKHRYPKKTSRPHLHADYGLR